MIYEKLKRQIPLRPSSGKQTRGLLLPRVKGLKNFNGDTNLFGNLHNLFGRYCGTTHVTHRYRVSHDPLVVSYTSERNQDCFTTHNTYWNIHLKRNEQITAQGNYMEPSSSAGKKVQVLFFADQSKQRHTIHWTNQNWRRIPSAWKTPVRSVFLSCLCWYFWLVKKSSSKMLRQSYQVVM